MFDVESFFCAVIKQDDVALRNCFHEDAWIEWPCSNECFTLEEYIQANCKYPGEWSGKTERCEWIQGGFVMAAGVWPKDKSASFHAVSFVKLQNGKIASMVEYWADDGPAPEWRKKMGIGKPIHIREE